MADRLALPCLVRRVHPDALREGRSQRERPTRQEAARSLRYQALEAMRVEAGCDCIATAHNRDDQAETVLLRLMRGSGPDGLGGVPERSPDGRVVRPLLDVARRDIEDWARARGLVWREDASNADDRYARNRLRRHWLPGLIDAFNPQLLRAIAQLAEAQRRDSEWLDDLVREARVGLVGTEAGVDGLILALEGWGKVPEGLARRLVRSVLSELGAGRDVSRVHIQRVLGFLRSPWNHEPGRTIELPGGLRLSREAQRFVLRQRQKERDQ
jgi:tRNA(Ile)-lysidine synthase